MNIRQGEEVFVIDKLLYGIVTTVNRQMNIYTVCYNDQRSGGQFERKELQTKFDRQLEMVREIVRSK